MDVRDLATLVRFYLSCLFQHRGDVRVGLPAISVVTFLHHHHIAHLDIAHENILMNHHGKLPGDPFLDIWPPPEFRSTFAVRYYMMDFGCSVRFSPESHPRDHLVKPFNIAREQRAPEMDRVAKYDPYAADVYATGRLFYGWFSEIVPSVPGFLDLLRNMTNFNPSGRVSAAVALDRLKKSRSQTPHETLYRTREVDLIAYYLIPRSYCRVLFEIVSAGQFWLACRFTWETFRHWFIQLRSKGLEPKKSD